MLDSCSANSLSLKYLSSLNPYALLLSTLILLLMPSTFAVEKRQSYHASIPVLRAMSVAAILTSLGTLLSLACSTHEYNSFSAASFVGCIQILLMASFM